jgi:hypothetical protein
MTSLALLSFCLPHSGLLCCLILVLKEVYWIKVQFISLCWLWNLTLWCEPFLGWVWWGRSPTNAAMHRGRCRIGLLCFTLSPSCYALHLKFVIMFCLNSRQVMWNVYPPHGMLEKKEDCNAEGTACNSCLWLCGDVYMHCILPCLSSLLSLCPVWHD